MKKGSHHTEETKNNISRKMIAEGTCAGNKNPFYGKRHTEQSLKKMRLGKIGKKHTHEWKKKMSKRNAGKNNPFYGKGQQISNEKHYAWKGEDASYYAKHMWIRKNKPKVECCEWCGKKRKLQIANVTGRYTRCFDDYQWFCSSCHRNYDVKVANLKRMTDNINKYLDDTYGVKRTILEEP